MTRLQTYRAFLAAMSPAADPQEALEQGFYVEPPGGGVADRLTRRLELDPASTHLVLGGIGSGKTSQLLRAVTNLRESFHEIGDLVDYCDVSRSHDLTAAPKAGILLALAGLSIIRRVDELVDHRMEDEVATAIASIRVFAHGMFEDESSSGGWSDQWYPGVLEEPVDKSVPDHLRPHVRELVVIRDSFMSRSGTITLMFDSLDRLPDASTFKDLVEHDIHALKAARIGLVVVGPVRFIVGSDRALTDLFDHVHFQLATDPHTPTGMAFLCDVLRRRAEATGLLPEDCMPALAKGSGGVLRDLISLTKRSAEEAYAGGHPTIALSDVEGAIVSFGRSLALGLDDDQVRILKAVAKSGAFVVRGERELSLLETRRVLLYPDNRWAVHPTLQPLIETIPETSG